MKVKIVVPSIIVIVMLNIGLWYFWNVKTNRSDLVVQSVGSKGIFVGERTKSMIEQEEHNKVLRTIHESAENVRLGDSYKRAGQYEEAIQAYKKAYEVDPGNRTLVGRLLIETYEKLSRYDEAISVVDEILKKEPLVEYGIEKFTAIRSRLLAAKNQASASST